MEKKMLKDTDTSMQGFLKENMANYINKPYW